MGTAYTFGMDDCSTKISKALARWLRHRPDSIGLTLDAQGWVDVADLVSKAAATEYAFTRDDLLRVVAENDKLRFTLSDDGARIRAAQGHSVAVDVAAPVKRPPPVLYHGTVREFIEPIKKKGLLPGTRRDVHLSVTRETADAVARRRGAPVILTIETYPLLRDDFTFRVSENGVWLLTHVPVKYLRFP